MSELPIRVEGRFIHPEGRGCQTCGWFISNEDDPDNRQWLAHGHDPLHDVEARAVATEPGGSVPVEDVLFLLDRFVPER